MIFSITSESVMSATGVVTMWQPLRSIVSVSQKARTSRMRWVMKTMVVPLALSLAMISPSQSTSRPASVDVGSSSSRMRGLR